LLCICQILEKKAEYNGTVYRYLLFRDFEKTHGPSEILYNNFIELRILMKLGKRIKMYLN